MAHTTFTRKSKDTSGLVGICHKPYYPHLLSMLKIKKCSPEFKPQNKLGLKLILFHWNIPSLIHEHREPPDLGYTLSPWDTFMKGLGILSQSWSLCSYGPGSLTSDLLYYNLIDPEKWKEPWKSSSPTSHLRSDASTRPPILEPKPRSLPANPVLLFILFTCKKPTSQPTNPQKAKQTNRKQNKASAKKIPL